MEIPKEAVRKYSKPDLLMEEQSQTMLDNFIMDNAAFAAMFPMFAPPYATDWQTELTAAENMPSNENVQNEIDILTQDLKDEMKAARSHYSTMMVYLKLTYPNNAGVLELFGQDQFEKGRNKYPKLTEIMELVYLKANSAPYNAALIAKGYTQAQIDMFGTLEQSLRDKNKAEEDAKSSRPLKLQNLIIAHNIVWDRMVMVHEAAKVVFESNYAKQQQYLLYPENGPTPPPVPDEAITATTNQSVLQTIYLSIGTSLAGNGQIVEQEWGDDSATEIILADGMVNYPKNYDIVGSYNTKMTGAGLVHITGLQMPNCRLTAFELPDLTNPQLSNLFLNDNLLTTFIIKVMYNNLINIRLQNNNLDTASVNGNLINANSWNTNNGYFDISGGNNAAPTGQGLAAKNQLIARGWTVITN